jgi:EAL domain-containing protein (putative c-di-GMP-specific phosphodiesterase class I)
MIEPIAAQEDHGVSKSEHLETIVETATTTGGDVIQESLVAIRNHLDMEVAYFSEFIGNESVFRRVDAPGLEHLIKVGDSRSLDDVYCRHILEGRLPELIPDTSKEPLARDMPITSAVPIGSHVSIPILLADGTPFGMFCCLSPRVRPDLNERDLATMRVFAGLATRQVNNELELLRSTRNRRSSIEAILAENGFEIVYQPIVDFKDMRIVSYEALCRFASIPYRSPDKWFQDATAVGLGTELELTIIEATVGAFEHLPADVTLSINASPDTVVSGRLADALDDAYLDRTIIELTEHSQVADYAKLHAMLAPLKTRGVRLAIDDAGAGYSGLQHIVQMAPEMIKLDMSLTRGVDQDPARRALASAMIFYAGETGAIVVAEGIETESELQTLQALGVHRGQGYLLGKPGRLDVTPSRRRVRIAG